MKPAPIISGSGSDIANAAAHLRSGGLVAFPTETVYGLGADATNDEAVARIFTAKGRPHFNPLIVHVSDTAMAAQFAVMNDVAARLAEIYWPGPLTLVLPRRQDPDALPISRLVSAGLDTVAVRLPAGDISQRLIAAVSRPLAAPSANLSGTLSPTRATDIRLPPPPDGPLVIDGGPCSVGIESTVMDCTGDRPAILRPGAVTGADIMAATGFEIDDDAVQDPTAPRSPGQLAAHYAPTTPLRMNARQVGKDEALLAFGPTLPPGAATGATGAMQSLNLSPSGNLVEAAANFFAMLHELDRGGHAMIAVMDIPEKELGIAINDRLRRAVISFAAEMD